MENKSTYEIVGKFNGKFDLLSTDISSSKRSWTQAKNYLFNWCKSELAGSDIIVGLEVDGWVQAEFQWNATEKKLLVVG